LFEEFEVKIVIHEHMSKSLDSIHFIRQIILNTTV